MVKGKFKIKLIVDMQSVGRVEDIVEIPYQTTMKKIRELFPKFLGVPYDDNCDWEYIPDSITIT